MIEKLKNAFRSCVAAIYKAIDIRDCFVFGGLGVMGYGLYLFRPWVAFAVCGAILFLIGFVPVRTVK